MNEPGPPSMTLPKGARRLGTKLVLALLIGVVAITAIWLLRDRLSLEQLAAQEAQLRNWYDQHPLQVLAIAALLYLAIAAFSVPVGTPLSLLYGWLFGWPLAVALVNCTSTAGAVLAFWSSRYLFRDFIESWLGDRAVAVERRVQQDGAFYLLALRVIPVVPFFVVNLAMGLTRLPTRTFWWVSQLGMLPATCVYVGVGASVPSLEKIAEEGLQSLLSWRLFGALVVLGIAPLVIKKGWEAWRGSGNGLLRE